MTETLTKDVDSIKKDCEESLNLLHERISRCFNFDSTSQLNAEDSVAVWNNFISRKDIILPPDEYKAVVGRLEVYFYVSIAMVIADKDPTLMV